MSKRTTTIIGIAALLIIALAVPAYANPPQQIEEPLFIIALDVEHELVAFWNMSRDDFCAWEAGGFMGDPPVTDAVTITFKETGNGVVMAKFKATRPVELWQVDADADFSGPCQDTDGQTGPWATGSLTWSGTDNDFDVSGTRTNSFGDVVRGTVQDMSGVTWHFSGQFRALIDRDDNFRVVVDKFNLRRTGR